MIWLKGAHQKSAKFQTFDCSCEISPNFDRLLLLKVYKISAKEVQRIYVSWHWHMIQNLKKNWYVVSKMTRIWWILTQSHKSLKNLLFDMFLFVQNVCLAEKNTEELSFMKLKSDVKFEKKLTYSLENDMRNLANFHQSTQKCQNRDFDWILFSKAENAWAKNLQRNYV